MALNDIDVVQVLGAAMFYAKVGEQSVVYTGDYNTTPDRHLGSAWMDKVRPDLFITETTYATMIRDSKRCREHDFLRRVSKTVENGGKVWNSHKLAHKLVHTPM
jgi:integrator complex subunit 11